MSIYILSVLYTCSLRFNIPVYSKCHLFYYPIFGIATDGICAKYPVPSTGCAAKYFTSFAILAVTIQSIPIT